MCHLFIFYKCRLQSGSSVKHFHWLVIIIALCSTIIKTLTLSPGGPIAPCGPDIPYDTEKHSYLTYFTVILYICHSFVRDSLLTCVPGVPCCPGGPGSPWGPLKKTRKMRTFTYIFWLLLTYYTHMLIIAYFYTVQERAQSSQSALG